MATKAKSLLLAGIIALGASVLVALPGSEAPRAAPTCAGCPPDPCPPPCRR